MIKERLKGSLIFKKWFLNYFFVDFEQIRKQIKIEVVDSLKWSFLNFDLLGSKLHTNILTGVNQLNGLNIIQLHTSDEAQDILLLIVEENDIEVAFDGIGVRVLEAEWKRSR